MRRAVRVAATWALLSGCLAPSGRPSFPNPTFPASPRLAISAEERAVLRAGPGRDAAVRAAAPFVDGGLTIPDGPGGWVFSYACADDGSTLREAAPGKHECPVCRKSYSDPRTLAAFRALRHADVEQAALALGWAYLWTGEDVYAREVRRILTRLAEGYAGYPDRVDRWGRRGIFAPLGGRRYAQSLDEAVGVLRLAKAYDLTRSSGVWSAADRLLVEDQFFRATAASLLRFNQGLSNHQTWYNAGLLAIASVLADGDLVRKALSMKGGVEDQLLRAVGDDGLWHEGTMAYHNYALQALVETADACRRIGLDLHRHPRLRAMIEAPAKAAYPNGQFPAINDSDPAEVGMFAWAFQWAARVTGDPSFAKAGSVPLRSDVLRSAGLAALRQGAGEQAVCAFLDYGPHGGGHGHLDKLNLMLYAGGREWMPDPGRLTYSHREYRTWVKHTVAHNTVALGGRSQRATSGKLLWFREGPDWSACAAESDGAYPGAVLRRSLLLTPSMLVDVFDVQAREATQIDWIAHVLSDPVGTPGGRSTSLPPGDGYEHLTDAVAIPPRPLWDFAAGPGRTLRVWFAAPSAEDVILANGIGYRVDQKVPCIIRRRQGTSASFVTVIDLTGAGSGVRGVDVDSSVRVRTSDALWELRFSPEDVTVRTTPAD
jgi:oligo-alginate lyase